MSREGSPYEASQSGHGSGQRINTSASHRNQGGRGGADLCNGSTIKNGSSIKAPVDRDISSLLKKLIPGSHRMSNS